MPRTNSLIALLVLLIAAGAVVLALALRPDADDATPPAPGATAPRPLAPADGVTFADSAVVLRWEWPPPLAEGEVFAVRLGYDDEPPREAWTDTSSLDARDLIDSYNRATGPFSWQVAVIATTEDGAFAHMVSAWSPVQTLERVRHLSPTPSPPGEQPELARYVLAQDPADPTALIDQVRHLVHDNAALDRQDTFRADYSDAVEMVYASLQGTGEKPHLLCDGAATTVLTVLQELGIESRLIFLYGDDGAAVAEHTMLEVFNPATQRWELYDVLNDLHFVAVDSGARLSIEHLVFGPLDAVAACDAAGTCDAAGVAEQAYLLEAFRYGHSETFWVNPERFDLSRRFPENGGVNLAEYETGNSRDFVFRLESWTGAD